VDRCSQIVLVLLLTSAPVLAGCTQGMTSSSDAASSTAGGSTDGGRVVVAGQMPGSPARPNPKEFVASADLRDIHFDFDRYDIRPEDAPVLDANAESLKSHPTMMILIEGHADQRGTPEYNLALGDRRARASMNYLVSRGVRSTRISIISYGKERPLCEGSNEDCWSQNRRAHFMVKGR
jgi:peptidoglycan-associated lipoprotein